ncbi:tRNA (N6-isopentenyl adenosine(37)-C2)-methylthiotransferase MiaB [Bythopirellula polymerisocia]|uniref:tRNA-2-methylthio-N(6)-dimethylallyladenosine synthase n=1 Tax=Bythopirellula polymerisocia TaxID=2528003 RepID=A0A5C6D0E6_9BACT|nr:tRNA (N6-isopentenyl adenosine(37)-C2)-methylthiotransferase MiaB [Bythopirellula polymerisocia]TWU30372.1 tRNA-2-methylthio-N(6)-dimethylallyladenosine synthase [Bythopirellula polymerisocia]
MVKKLYIETVGCQMNVLDSELVVASLRKQGFELTDNSLDADTILFNTCSVRQHAEDKIYSALGRLKNAKQTHPHKVIGVLGCMAQKDQRLIFERAPYVDLIVGPGQLHQVPDLIAGIEAGSGPRMEVSLGRKDGSRQQIERSHESFDPLRDAAMRPTPYQAYVRIMIGCDKFCTYCIVPSVRGPEQSRPPCEILAEARQLADEGCKEIILLGQTVNSYRYKQGDSTTRMSDLLVSLSAIDGLERLKFVTNYPKDMTDDLLTAVRDLPKCAKYLHVPAQSGSNPVLERMKRGYTIEDYREMMERIRQIVPDVAVTSDFIVGFCGETEEDFQLTCNLVHEQRFKNSFIFKYSERPGTRGADLYPDDVPEEVKKRRNNELLAMQNIISEVDNQPFIGRQVNVLIEGPSKASERQGTADSEQLQLTGRTMCDRIVVFDGNRRQIGQTLPITVYDANAHTLFGAVVTQHVGPELFSLGA